jgi:hypothetical protein
MLDAHQVQCLLKKSAKNYSTLNQALMNIQACIDTPESTQEIFHSKLYTLLGFHAGVYGYGAYFDALACEDEDSLYNWLVMQRLVTQLLQTQELKNKDLQTFLQKFNDESLTTLLENHAQEQVKGKLLDSAQLLKGMVNELLQEILEKKTEQEVENGTFWLWYALNPFAACMGCFQVLLAPEIAQEYVQNHYPIASSFNTVNLNQLSQDELAQRLNQLKQELMNAAEVNQIKRFHPIINFICNLINKIYPVFESNYKNQLIRNFSFFEQKHNSFQADIAQHKNSILDQKQNISVLFQDLSDHQEPRIRI